LAISHEAEPLTDAELKAIYKPARWLLRSQLQEGGWPLIGGETPGILATASAIRGVNALLKRLPLEPDLASESLFVLQRGARWLLNAQLSDDGWNFDQSVKYNTKSHVTSTGSALVALAEVAADHSGDPISNDLENSIFRAHQFLNSARQKSGAWVSLAKPDGDINATARALIALYAIDARSSGNPSAEILNKFTEVTRYWGVGLAVTEDELTGPAGIVTIYNDPFPAVIEASAEYGFDTPLFLTYVIDIVGQDVQFGTRLRCLVTGKIWDQITWPSAANIATLSTVLLLPPEDLERRLVTSALMNAQQLSSYSGPIVERFRDLGSAVLAGLPDASSQIRLFEGRSADEALLGEVLVRILAPISKPKAAIEEFVLGLLKQPRTLSTFASDPAILDFSCVALMRYRNALAEFLSTDQQHIDEIFAADASGVRAGFLKDRVDVASVMVADLTSITSARDTALLVERLIRLQSCVDALRSIEEGLVIHEERQLLSLAETKIKDGWASIKIEPEISILVVESPPAAGLVKTKLRVATGGIPIENLSLTVSHSVGGTFSISDDYKERISSYGYEYILSGETLGSSHVHLSLSLTGTLPNGEPYARVVAYDVPTRASPGIAAEEPWEPIRFRYTLGKYLTDPELIVGRRDLLIRFEDKLCGAQSALALNGAWRMGKSSFVQALKLALDSHANVKTIYLDIQGLGHSFATLLRALKREVMRSLVDLPQSRTKITAHAVATALDAVTKRFEGLKIDVFGVDLQGDPEGRFNALIEEAKSAFQDADKLLGAAEAILVIIIDEINEIIKYPEAAFALSFLRSLIQRSENIRFFAASYDIFTPFADIDKTFFNIFEMHFLPGLTTPEISQLLDLADGKLQCSPEIIAELHRLTGGTPFLAVCIADELIEIANRAANGRISLEQLELATAAAGTKVNQLFEALWGEALQLGAGDLCRRAAENGGSFGPLGAVSGRDSERSGETAPNIVSRLCHKGILVEDQNTVHLFCPLFVRWIQRFG
jgi:hypothetical protein